MRILYLFCLLFLVVVMFRCIKWTLKKKERYSMSIVKLLFSATFAMIVYSGFLICTTEKMALFTDSLYFIATDWMVFFMLEFVMDYTELVRKRKFIRNIFWILAIVDSAALMINNASKFMFDVVSKSYGGDSGGGVYFTEQFMKPHYLHLGLCYIMVIMSMGILIYKAIKSPRLYKSKYMSILITFAFVIICNAVCYTQKLPVDISLIFYIVLAIAICYFTYEAVPRGLVSQVQSYIAENTNRGMICFDLSGKCIYINKQLKEKISDVQFADLKKYFIKKHQKLSQKSIVSDKWNVSVSVNGEKKNYLNIYRIIKDKQGRCIGYFVVIEDRTSDVKKFNMERYKATHDMMTNLYNRQGFFEKADSIITKNPDMPRYMIVTDIKDFKLINNLYGQAYGNEILEMEVGVLKKYEFDNNICGRTAGDKFALLVSKEDFDEEKFKKDITQINGKIIERKFGVYIHAGIYDITGERQPAQLLYNKVTIAISTIHHDYDKVFVKYDKSMMQDIVKEKKMIAEFEQAIDQKQFCMYLQPQVNTRGKVIGAEALVRWNHPKEGLIFPGQFIEVFEKNNIIHKLDLEIWKQAALKLAEWKAMGRDDIHISINISTKDFYYLDVYKEIVDITEKYGINPANLKLEITESAVMNDEKTGFSTLDKLKKYGFDIELDDFGSGYSSLNMLKNLNVDVLKIDRMFLQETDNQERSRIILDSIIGMAKRLGMIIVTEGVEMIEQVNSLKAMGCDIFQGYYFDKPIAVSQFEEKYM